MKPENARLYAVAYDIPDDNRRLKVAKVLNRYGKRVQYSVFECELNPPLLKKLIADLRRVVVDEEDAVRIYPLAEPPTVVVGEGFDPPEDAFVI